jgi:hypothetical protein
MYISELLATLYAKDSHVVRGQVDTILPKGGPLNLLLYWHVSGRTRLSRGKDGAGCM